MQQVIWPLERHLGDQFHSDKMEMDMFMNVFQIQKPSGIFKCMPSWGTCAVCFGIMLKYYTSVEQINYIFYDLQKLTEHRSHHDKETRHSTSCNRKTKVTTFVVSLQFLVTRDTIVHNTKYKVVQI
jgi:hypothetical protein